MAESPELAAIEQIVGALHGATKGVSAGDLHAGMLRFAMALDSTLPAWLTLTLIEKVEERMRQLKGRWKATPYGGRMQLDWPLQA
jgi:hypothetical protein